MIEPSLNRLKLFASAAKGLEDILAEELRLLGASDVRTRPAGVRFTASMENAFRACLWSRLASRVLLNLHEFSFDNFDDLYRELRGFAWEEHVPLEGTLAIDGDALGATKANTLFAALKTKDAVVDRMRQVFGRRPSVDTAAPDVRLHLLLENGRAVISLDLSGESLHKRGYRQASVAAPMKENVAAAILIRAGWPAIAAGGGMLIDPLCGSGTLTIEAALMAADIAPGLYRKRFGFHGWLKFQPSLWRNLLDEAKKRRQRGLAKLPPIIGSDIDPQAVAAARTNVVAAGLRGQIDIKHMDARFIMPPGSAAPGLWIANPPYGERLSDESRLRSLYEVLGSGLRERFQGWRAAVFTGNPPLAMRLGIRARKKYSLYSGAIPCSLFTFDVKPSFFMRPSCPPTPDAAVKSVKPASGEKGGMLANRLLKNLKTIGGWAKSRGITCYRLYDADLPQYAAAIDVYRDDSSNEIFAVVQEYEAPASIPVAKAKERLDEIIAAIPTVLDIPVERVIRKTRRRQRKLGQYTKISSGGSFHQVREDGLLFLVNFTDYLDTGLFLDHRPTRHIIKEMADGVTFLNLFCYTASATLYAAAGGASGSISVDMSPTYLAWARRNMELNGIDGRRHKLIRADYRWWLKCCRDRFDLIFLDPPTFSRSKKSGHDFNLQEDHAQLIQQTVQLLSPGGVLIFSNNFRRFKLDETLLTDLDVRDITPQTIPRDFSRRPKIHSCWLIRKPQY